MRETNQERVKGMVDAIGIDLAEGLVEYANLVHQLAEDFTEEQLEEIGAIRNRLEEDLPDWDWEDWYALQKTVCKEKHREDHFAWTAETILDRMPFYAREAAQEAVKQLVEAKQRNNTVAILCFLFRCDELDIRDSLESLNKIDKFISEKDYQEHKLLLEFLETLREKLWKRGKVLQLRETK